ncbi:hypothetical protein R1flu_017473 [Riccia fluitans]|uniref:Glutamyl-tRNA reductase n=1 Tax=Riccia fluitans TaxID=41844 RepID=A0ABD1ZDC3_9MARC
MASIRSVAGGVVAPSSSVKNVLDEHRLPTSSGRCSLRSSSIFGAGLDLPLLTRKFKLTHTTQGVAGARAEGSGDGSQQLPASHRYKVASQAAFEHLQAIKNNRYTQVKSSILVLGLSVHTCPVSMREKLAVPEAEWPRAIGELVENNHIEEAAVLSTCNRMEIYVVALSWNRGVQEVTEWMSRTSGVPVEELREHLFILRDRDATQHLFRVSSGLDSLVLGEGQILAQVKQVYKVGQTAPGFGRNLNGLFKQAITAGKRVRCETSISAGAVSVSSAAVELAVMKLPEQGILSAKVLIVGAGKMSKLLVKHLISKGCTRMIVVNRSEGRVAELQAEFGEAELIYKPLPEMMNCAAEANVIFTSTASETPLFYKEHAEQLAVVPESLGGVRHFIDISVPRNVGACVAEVPTARVYNVDDLKEVVAANKEERKRKAQEAQVIIEEELRSFDSWRDSLETVPTIKKLRAYAEGIRTSELEKCLNKMGDDLTKKNRKLVEELSRGIVNKLLHGPMQNLRSDGTDARTVTETIENMHALERMFDLKADLSALEKQFKAAAEKVSSQ